MSDFKFVLPGHCHQAFTHNCFPWFFDIQIRSKVFYNHLYIWKVPSIFWGYSDNEHKPNYKKHQKPEAKFFKYVDDYPHVNLLEYFPKYVDGIENSWENDYFEVRLPMTNMAIFQDGKLSHYYHGSS